VVDERTQLHEPSDAGPPVEDHSHDIYTVANTITVLRLILVPFFFAVLIHGSNDVLAFVLFAVAASTDWLDGQIARRTGTVTVIGKAIDPLVDRLLIAAGVLGLYVNHRIPLWIVVALFMRDAYLMYGSWRLEQSRHHRMPVTYAGKVTTAVLLTGFAALVLNWPQVPGAGIVTSAQLPGWGSTPVGIGLWVVYAGVALSLATAVHYSVLYLRVIGEGGQA